jgi:NitT/TauT family transport system ATP-binding protein
VDVLLPPSLLAFSGVGKRFPDGTLAGVDLSVAPGEFVSILGPSGCGKSTLLRVAAGLSQASDGTAKVGTDKIGYVFQDPTDTKVFYFEGDTSRSSV